jgi:hypothetical protein
MAEVRLSEVLMSEQVSLDVSGWVSGLPGFSHRAVNRARNAAHSSEVPNL